MRTDSYDLVLTKSQCLYIDRFFPPETDLSGKYDTCAYSPYLTYCMSILSIVAVYFHAYPCFHCEVCHI